MYRGTVSYVCIIPVLACIEHVPYLARQISGREFSHKFDIDCHRLFYVAN